MMKMTNETMKWIDHNEKGVKLELILRKKLDLYRFNGVDIDGVVKILNYDNGVYTLELAHGVIDYPLIDPVLTDIHPGCMFDLAFYFSTTIDRVKKFFGSYYPSQFEKFVKHA